MHSIVRNQQSQYRLPKLTVHGYTRKNHSTSIPVAVQGIIVSYYSLWINRKFIKKDLQKVMDSRCPQPINVHIHNVIVHGAKLDFSLKLEKIGGNKILVELLATFQVGMESIGGHFDFVFDQNRCEPQWNIFYAKNAVSSSYNPLQLPIVWKTHQISVSQHFEVKTYIDLTEMKWKPQTNRTNFNITPKLGISGFHQISNEDLEGFWSGERKDILAEFPGGLQMKCGFRRRCRTLYLFPDLDCPYPFHVKCEIGTEIVTMKWRRSASGEVCYNRRIDRDMIGNSVIFHVEM